PEILEGYRSAGELPDDVVIQIGNNGPVYGTEVEAIRRALEGVPNVYLVNVEVPRSWESEVNDELQQAVDSWPEATLIDWHATIAGHIDLTYDGIHLDPEGDALYARMVRDAIVSKQR
ncbi:MAG: acetyltransferase, partial [Solirubrobacterales bacterium]|nr:acetyltransferase [Solirubrobacterales bacterium]